MKEEESEPRTEPRIFARIRSFDLACPKCDKVYAAVNKNHHGFIARTSRFRCTECGLTVAVGVTLWEVMPGLQKNVTPPIDTVPSLKQAVELRAYAVASLGGKRMHPDGKKARVNRFIGRPKELPEKGGGGGSGEGEAGG